MMGELNSRQTENGLEGRFDKKSFVRRQLPYLVALALAISGVAYTNISHQPLVGYWEFLALATGVVCVVTQWENAPDRNARVQLIGMQALHWAAVLVTMNIIVLGRVQTMLPAPAVGLVLLTLLALGTFLAGVNFLSVQICFLGVATGNRLAHAIVSLSSSSRGFCRWRRCRGLAGRNRAQLDIEGRRGVEQRRKVD